MGLMGDSSRTLPMSVDRVTAKSSGLRTPRLIVKLAADRNLPAAPSCPLVPVRCPNWQSLSFYQRHLSGWRWQWSLQTNSSPPVLVIVFQCDKTKERTAFYLLCAHIGLILFWSDSDKLGQNLSACFRSAATHFRHRNRWECCGFLAHNLTHYLTH